MHPLFWVYPEFSDKDKNGCFCPAQFFCSALQCSPWKPVSAQLDIEKMKGEEEVPGRYAWYSQGILWYTPGMMNSAVPSLNRKEDVKAVCSKHYCWMQQGMSSDLWTNQLSESPRICIHSNEHSWGGCIFTFIAI